jgi:putative PIN family toxin of toxin-antitoxin system
MDTNQIIVGSLWPSGPAGFLLETWRKRKIDIIVSPAILDEVERVLITKFETGHEAADYLKKVLAFHGKLVDPQEKINVIKNDPTDNMFLEAAIAGKADFIVSRDNDLLKLKEFRCIPINSPEVMAQWIRKNIK